MSDNHMNFRGLGDVPPEIGEGSSYGEIDHTSQLSDNIEVLFTKEDFSDVTFVVNGERFFAHRVILAARSDYFRAMLFGGMRESSQGEITLKDTNVSAFRLILRYVYTGRISLSGLKEDMVIEVLGLANQYGFEVLQLSVADYLKAILSNRNLCNIFKISLLYMLKDLTDYCLLFADRNASEVLNTPGFVELPLAAVEQLIHRDSFCAPEIDIFNSMREWIKEQANVTKDETDELLSCIRLSLIPQKDLLNVVRFSGLVDPDAILDAIEDQTQKRTSELRYRGFVTPDSNIATHQLNAQVINGTDSNALLSGVPSEEFRLLTKHVIGDDRGIVIQLGSPYLINTIKLLLPEKERMYSYYVEVSMDSADWVRVVDHTSFLCRSRQMLHFSPRSVKYIRIVGTYNSQCTTRMFHLSSLEAMFSSKPIPVDPFSGILVPQTNVATIENNAIVLEGVSRSRNTLINGQTTDYDWDNGYTCHQLGSGAITVQLPQPYLIGDMRLLLWDCDERFYSYYVEVSVDQQSWTRVVDMSQKQCSSWQYLEFKPIPVVFVRIIGTFNSANEVFHCVHFECPANEKGSPSGERSVMQNPNQLVQLDRLEE